MPHHMTLCLAITALAAGAAGAHEPRSPDDRRYRSQPPVATIPGADPATIARPVHPLDPFAN